MRPLSEKNYAELSEQLAATGTVDMSKLTPLKSVRAKNNNEESRSQKALIAWWAKNCKRFDIPEQLLFSIPNGMAFGGKAEWQVKTSIIRGKNAKLEGLRPGVPDLMLAVPSGMAGVFSGKSDVTVHKYAGLFVEMKTATGSVSTDQFMIHGYLLFVGYKVVICRSTEEAIREIESYLT